MDVSNGLSVVTPTLDAWVLRALVQTTRPLSGRQIARLVEHGSLVRGHVSADVFGNGAVMHVAVTRIHVDHRMLEIVEADPVGHAACLAA